MSKHPLLKRRARLPDKRALVIACAALAALLPRPFLLAQEQGAPPLPTESRRSPVIRALILPTVTPVPTVGDAEPDADSVAGTPVPEATATQPPPAPETPVAATPAGGAYRVRGTLAVTTRAEGRPARTDRRTYEVAFAPAEEPAGRGVNRRIRLSPSAADAGAYSVALVEVGNAAVVMAGPSYWRIQARDDAAPLSLAMEPVLELARLAYAACSGDGGESPPESDDSTAGACVLTGSERVAVLLAGDDSSARVASSLLVARLDRARGVVMRYLLTAEIEMAGRAAAAPQMHSLEWSYEYEPAGALPVEIDWPFGVPRIGEVVVPGLAAGILPAPDRLLAVESVDGVVRLEMAMSREEAADAAQRLLGAAGWRVQDVAGALIASRDSESVVVSINAGATEATVSLDFVGVE